MFWDFGLIHMIVRVYVQSEAAAMEAAVAAHDACLRWVWRPFTFCAPWKSTPCNSQRNSTIIKEALDIGEEDGKDTLEELTIEFEQLTVWLKEVLGDKLKSTSRELDGHWRQKLGSNHWPS